MELKFPAGFSTAKVKYVIHFCVYLYLHQTIVYWQILTHQLKKEISVYATKYNDHQHFKLYSTRNQIPLQIIIYWYNEIIQVYKPLHYQQTLRLKVINVLLLQQTTFAILQKRYEVMLLH